MIGKIKADSIKYFPSQGNSSYVIQVCVIKRDLSAAATVSSEEF